MKLRACLGNGPFTASSDPRRKKKIANYPGHMAYPMSELSLGSAYQSFIECFSDQGRIMIGFIVVLNDFVYVS